VKRVFLCVRQGVFRARVLAAFLAPLALAAPFLAGCSINYEEGHVIEELEDTVPNIRMTGLKHRVATKDRLIMEMSAEKSESYEKTKRITISGVKFREYDSEGESVSEGKANQVIYFIETKNADIQGNIEIISHREKGGIRTERLYWDDARRFLSGSPDSETEIFDEDGSRFMGQGFEVDMKRLIISFMQTVEGNYVVPD
jgi:LPS export ABC transporter protein LptC